MSKIGLKWVSLGIAVCVIFFAIINYFHKPDLILVHTPPANNISAWLWDGPDTFTTDQLTKMFGIAKNERITRIYLRVDDYVDIYDMKEGPTKEAKIKSMDDSIKRFILLAKDYGITVEALGGNTDWAEADQRIYPHTLFNAVLRYNAANNKGARFKGIQFDVESNNSRYYTHDKHATLINYLELVQELINAKEANNLSNTKDFSLGFTIPILYDNNTPDVVINWQDNGSKPVGYHLLDILDKAPGGYVVLMDYRNHAEGTDGSIDNATALIDYISKNTNNVKIVIGQETTKVSPAKITFYDTNKTYFKQETAKIVEAFSSYSAFGGIAIHHLKSYIDL